MKWLDNTGAMARYQTARIKKSATKTADIVGTQQTSLMPERDQKQYLNPHARTLGTTINETVQTAGY